MCLIDRHVCLRDGHVCPPSVHRVSGSLKDRTRYKECRTRVGKVSKECRCLTRTRHGYVTFLEVSVLLRCGHTSEYHCKFLFYKFRKLIWGQRKIYEKKEEGKWNNINIHPHILMQWCLLYLCVLNLCSYT